MIAMALVTLLRGICRVGVDDMSYLNPQNLIRCEGGEVLDGWQIRPRRTVVDMMWSNAVSNLERVGA